MTRSLDLNRTTPCINHIRGRLDDPDRSLYSNSRYCDNILDVLMTKLTDEELQYVISHLSIGYTPKYPFSFVENVAELKITYKLKKK